MRLADGGRSARVWTVRARGKARARGAVSSGRDESWDAWPARFPPPGVDGR